jgi:hypothetical protein
VRGLVRVQRSVWRGIEVSTKTKKGYRNVFVDSSTVRMLKEYLGGRTTGRVFQTKNGTPLENHNIVRLVLNGLASSRAVCTDSGMAGSAICKPTTSRVTSQRTKWATQACGLPAGTHTSRRHFSVILWRG